MTHTLKKLTEAELIAEIQAIQGGVTLPAGLYQDAGPASISQPKKRGRPKGSKNKAKVPT